MGPGEQGSPNFLVGGRYRNRTGAYEVMEIIGNRIRVAYDDGTQVALDAEIQSRIIRNMAAETATLEPYKGSGSAARNRRYFRSVGFLTSRMTMMEAIVPHKARAGFEETYRQLSGTGPGTSHHGYYVHGPHIDKWGNELRVTFDATNAELQGLDFGSHVEAVVNPGSVGSSWRINRNAFWWDLLRLGFRLGNVQDVELIRNSVPIVYREDFDDGLLWAK